MDPIAIRIANQRLNQAHPELAGRSLTLDPADASLRSEWQRYYHEAKAKAAPKPVVVPAAVPIPVAKGAIPACPGAPKPASVSKCDEVKNHVQEGDIVLRANSADEESELIAKMSGCDYSHAGIVARDAKGDLVVVDAYPGRGPAGDTKKNAVGSQSVDEFFCGHSATDGLVARPKDCVKAKQAADWALAQTKDPDYTFDLFDPWNKDNKLLYCADFVSQSFASAGVDLVPTKMDFLDASHRANTIALAREKAKESNWKAYIATDAQIEQRVLARSKGNSQYITPCQVANNAQTDPAAIYKAPAKAKPSLREKVGL